MGSDFGLIVFVGDWGESRIGTGHRLLRGLICLARTAHGGLRGGLVLVLVSMRGDKLGVCYY